MTTAKKEAAVELPLLEAGGPDGRLFINCGCGHRAGFHSGRGCTFITPGKPPTSGYSAGNSPGTPDVPCPCPTPREVVYIGGRAPVPAIPEVTK